MMTVGQMCVMGRGLGVSGFMVFCGFPMMFRRLVMMFCRLRVMLCCLF
jgi:hypothetical protein